VKATSDYILFEMAFKVVGEKEINDALGDIHEVVRWLEN